MKDGIAEVKGYLYKGSFFKSRLGALEAKRREELVDLFSKHIDATMNQEYRQTVASAVDLIAAFCATHPSFVRQILEEKE
tara:strand:- start:12348 stop:12587 length:240 start_codon:yes stop_codon:yes gene_type:complete